MTETPSSGAESEANSQHEEIGVDTLELTLKLPQKTLTRLFRMGELSGVSTDEIAHRHLRSTHATTSTTTPSQPAAI
ncbi:hypothetical protein QV65_13835 [Rhodococcus erythropolis]|nr:hypothetical protein QV65_13835 [Rhodococcus erythropolis]